MTLFDETILAKLNRSKKTFKKKQTPFLDQARHAPPRTRRRLPPARPPSATCSAHP